MRRKPHKGLAAARSLAQAFDTAGRGDGRGDSPSGDSSSSEDDREQGGGGNAGDNNEDMVIGESDAGNYGGDRGNAECGDFDEGGGDGVDGGDGGDQGGSCGGGGSGGRGGGDGSSDPMTDIQALNVKLSA